MLARMESRRDLYRAKRLLGLAEAPDRGLAEPSGKFSLEVAPSTLFSLAGAQNSKTPTIARLLIVSCISAALVVVFSSASFLLLALAYALLEYRFLISRVRRRSLDFDKDYPALVLSLASSVKAGVDPLDALVRAKDLFAEKAVITTELRLLSDRIDAGWDKSKAIASFGATVDHTDIKLFVTALLLNQTEGASIAETLQRLVRVTRQRQSFQRKLRAAMAMQKVSAVGISLCFLSIAAFQFVTNREGLVRTWHNALGHSMVLGGMCCMGVGFLWMMRVASRRFQ